jgi:aspartate aminotransferase
MLINTRLSERVKKVNPSSTLTITAKAKKLKAEGKDIVSLGAGEPDFDTPDFIKDAAKTAIDSGFTKYTPTTGIPELKELICNKFKRDNGLDYKASQIIVSCGAKHSIFNILLATINKGDDVLIPSPYWVSYPEMVKLCEGNPRFISTLAENNFKMTAKDLEKHVTLKSKLLILNSPSNPTGCVYTEPELRKIADICIKKKIMVIADEIYEKIIYDGLKQVSIAGFNKDIFDLTITVNGVSKSFSMTGWRIGYLGAPQDIAEAISKIQDHSTSNPTSISQKAAIAALKANDQFADRMCTEFQKRRDLVMKLLDTVPKIKYVKPQGAFYIFCDIAKTKMDSLTFANRLLDEAGVAVIPGDGFGANNYIRISFASSIEELEKAINKISTWITKI